MSASPVKHSFTQVGHPRTVQALVTAGDHVVSGSSSGEIAVWRPKETTMRLTEVHRLKDAHGGERVTSLAHVPAGDQKGRNIVVSCGFDGMLNFWSIPKLVRDLSVSVLRGVRLFAVAACGNFVAVAGGDDGGPKGGCLSVSQISYAKSISLLSSVFLEKAHGDNIYALAFMPRSSGPGRVSKKASELLWTGGRDGAVQLFEIEVDTKIRKPTLLQRIAFGCSIRSLTASAVSGMVWCGNNTGTISVLDSRLRVRSPHSIGVHHGAVYGLVIRDVLLPSGDSSPLVFSCGKDGRACALHGSRAPGPRLLGSPGITEELLHIKPLAEGAPPFLESLCLWPSSGDPKFVICGARDGRLGILPSSSPKGVISPAIVAAKRPSASTEPGAKAKARAKATNKGGQPASHQSSIESELRTASSTSHGGPPLRFGSQIIRWDVGKSWTPSASSRTVLKRPAEMMKRPAQEEHQRIKRARSFL